MIHDADVDAYFRDARAFFPCEAEFIERVYAHKDLVSEHAALARVLTLAISLPPNTVGVHRVDDLLLGVVRQVRGARTRFAELHQAPRTPNTQIASLAA